MTHREALRKVLAIVATISSPCLGPRAEEIYLVTEELGDPECTFDGAEPAAALKANGGGE